MMLTGLKLLIMEYISIHIETPLAAQGRPCTKEIHFKMLINCVCP